MKQQQRDEKCKIINETEENHLFALGADESLELQMPDDVQLEILF